MKDIERLRAIQKELPCWLTPLDILARRSKVRGVGSNLTRTVKWLMLLCLVIDITLAAEWSNVDTTDIHTNKQY